MKKFSIISITLTILILSQPGWSDWMSVGPDGGYIQAMAMDPSNPLIMYAIPYGEVTPRVQKTTDGGQSWYEIGQINYRTIYNLAVDPHDGNYIYASCRSNRIFRSTDAGVTWDYVALPYYGYYLAADPHNPGRVYVAGYSRPSTLNQMTIFISTNYGQSWSSVVVDTDTTSVGYSCTVDPSDSGKVYIAGSLGRVFKSTDNGNTWTLCNNGMPSNGVTYALAVNPGDSDMIMAGLTSYGVYRTTNKGDTWIQTGTMSPIYYLAYSPGSPNIGYAAYNMVYMTTDYGATWFIPNPGLYFTYAKGFVPHPDSGDIAYACGSSGIFRTDDGGTNWATAHTGMRISSITTISVNAQNPQNVYLEMDEIAVFKSTDCGNIWERCSDFLSCGNICGIGIVPGVESDILYALEGKG